MTEEFRRIEEERRRLNLPDRREHTYEQLENRITECVDQIEDDLARWIRRGLFAFGIIAFFCVISMLGFGYVLGEIQNQRNEACTAQNRRHDTTLALFKKVADEAKQKNPDQAQQIDEGRAANIAIINALQPKQNCDKVAPERHLIP